MQTHLGLLCLWIIYSWLIKKCHSLSLVLFLLLWTNILSSQNSLLKKKNPQRVLDDLSLQGVNWDQGYPVYLRLTLQSNAWITFRSEPSQGEIQLARKHWIALKYFQISQSWINSNQQEIKIHWKLLCQDSQTRMSQKWDDEMLGLICEVLVHELFGYFLSSSLFCFPQFLLNFLQIQVNHAWLCPWFPQTLRTENCPNVLLSFLPPSFILLFSCTRFLSSLTLNIYLSSAHYT